MQLKKRGILHVSIETTSYVAESHSEAPAKEIISLIDEADLERLKLLADICGIDLIYLSEEAGNENTSDSQIDFCNLVISELPQTSDEELKSAAKNYSINLNGGHFNAQDSESALRAKRQQSSRLFVSIKTNNEIITFKDFDLMFHLLREKDSENINTKVQKKRVIEAKYKNIKEQIDSGDLSVVGVKIPIAMIVEIDQSIVESDDEDEIDNPYRGIPPTLEELEGKI